MTSRITIKRFSDYHRNAVLALSLEAWDPVFTALAGEVPQYVFNAFYPDGWKRRQLSDISAFLDSEPDLVWVALLNEDVAGWIGGRIHHEDSMGEIYILAVSPAYQRQGIAMNLIACLTDHMREHGMSMMMVETGNDSGHAASRAAYESVGFERWPVARYFRKI